MEEQQNVMYENEGFTSVDSYVSKTFVQKDQTVESDIKTIRVSLQTDEDAHTWIREFSAETNTHWIVSNTHPFPERYLFRKRWVCHRSIKNKIAQGKTSNKVGCQAYVDIKIKKNNRCTRRNDPLLRGETPLQGVILIKLQHSHPIDEAPSHLRVDDDIRKIYEEAFENGISPSEAHVQYVNTILLKENASKIIADRRVNPSLCAVRHLHDAWRKKKYGDKATLLQQIKDNVESYKNQGIEIVWSEGTNQEPWVVLLVTPAMKENHSVQNCSDFIHVVTTGSGNAILITSSVTILFGDSLTGPLPLAVLIHETEKISAFKKSFKLLKENYENCFGGKSFPACFMTDNIPGQKKALSLIWPEATQLICHLRLLKAEWRYLTSLKMGVPVDKRKTYFMCFNRIMYADSESALSAAEFLFYDTVSHSGFRKRIQNLLSDKLREEWIQLYRSELTRGHNINKFAISVILTVKMFVPRRQKSFNPVELIDSAVSEWGNHVEYEVGNENYKPSKRDIWGEMPVDFDDDVRVDFKHRPLFFKREIRRKVPMKSENHKVDKPISHIIREICGNDQEPDGNHPVNIKSEIYGGAPEDSGDEQVDMNTEVPSNDDDYQILANVEDCGCPVSLRGEECDHQIALQNQLGRLFTIVPPSSWQDPGAITLVAVDQRSPSPSFLMDVTDNTILVANGQASTPHEEYTSQIEVSINPFTDTQESVTEEEPPRKADKAALLEEIGRILDLADSNAIEDHSSTLLQSLQEIREKEDATSAFLRFTSSVKKRRIN